MGHPIGNNCSIFIQRYLFILARILLIKTGQEISGELQTKVAKYILNTDIATIEKKHSGKFISNINFDAGQVNSLCSTGILNAMKDL